MSAWNALTAEERQAIVDNLPHGIDGYLKWWGWLQFAEAVEAKCREKNERPESDETEFDVVGEDGDDITYCASAAGPRDRALAEARNYALQYLDENTAVRIDEVVRTTVERYTKLPCVPARGTF